MIIWKEYWRETEKRVKETLKELDCPQSVIETVTGAIVHIPEKDEEILAKVKACKTPKEVVKAVQVYIRQTL